MADINVVFGADTTQLDAAVSKVKREVQSLVPGAPGSGILTPLPPGLGGPPKPPIPPGGGYRLLTDEERAAAKAANEFADASTRAGIDFGAMAERMAARLVIFEAIRLAIQGIKYAFDQISNLQQAKIQFDATSSSVGELATNFKSLQLEQKAALEPDIGKMVQIKNALEDFGMSERKAILETQDLSQWSKLLGVDAVRLAEALGRVSQGEGSLQDMRLVTHMMGEQSAAGRELIQTYVDLQKAQKNLELENATVEKSMAAVMRATKEMVDDAERQTDRQMSLIEKLAAGQAKKAAAGGGPSFAMPGFAPGAIAPRQAPDIGRALEYGGIVGGMRVPQEAMAQYKRGLEEIGALEGRNAAFVRAQVHNQILGYQDVMRAGREATDDEMRGLDRIDEANRAHAEFQKTAMAGRVAGVKAEISAALPQAVTAPPAAQWEGFANSIKGIGLLTKDQFDTGIVQLVTELKNVQTASNGTTTAVGDLQLLFTSG